MNGGPIVVYGAGGHGREVAAVIGALRAAGTGWELMGFLSDDLNDADRLVAGAAVLGGEAWLDQNPGIAVAIGIGSPAARRDVVRRIETRNVAFPSLVHPSAVVLERARIGPGVLVSAGAVVSVDVEVGPFSVVNVLASVSHDCQLGAFATLAPRVALAGNTVVGEGADIGVGAVSIPSAKIGRWSIIGAGAVVLGEVPEHCTAVGVPARIIRHRPSQPGG